MCQRFERGARKGIVPERRHDRDGGEVERGQDFLVRSEARKHDAVARRSGPRNGILIGGSFLADAKPACADDLGAPVRVPRQNAG